MWKESQILVELYSYQAFDVGIRILGKTGTGMGPTERGIPANMVRTVVLVLLSRLSLATFYNLQLYGWKVSSPIFDKPAAVSGGNGAGCGNNWLGLIDACPYPGGIGLCNNWGITVDRMVACGLQNSTALPWIAKYGTPATVLPSFCRCLWSTFVPTARDGSVSFLAGWVCVSR